MQHFSQIAPRVCTLELFIVIVTLLVNPRRACAVRVTVVVLFVCMCACINVCMCVCVRNTGIVLNFADFPKNASFKSYGVICLPRAAPAS